MFCLPDTANPKLACCVIVLACLLAAPRSLLSQQTISAVASGSNISGPDSISISLDEAIRRARLNDPTYANASANRSAAALDSSIARSALLPNVVYHNQYLYTQTSQQRTNASSGSTASAQATTPRFIANNSLHEYISQGQVNETLSLALLADYKRAAATANQAAAQHEIAGRNLVTTVVTNYYALLAADQKLAVATRAAAESSRFAALTRDLESGREVAHADVVKADLQSQQRQRDLADIALAAQRARLDLGILLFQDPRTQYQLADSFSSIPAVPSRGEIESAAMHNNPDLRAALAESRVAAEEVNAARAAYLPDLALNYTYGIDAPQFAIYGPDHVRNLGYSASVTVDIPVWDWFATHDRVKQSELRQSAAHVALTYAQRRLVADLEQFYAEAVTSANQITSLEQSAQTAAESLRLVKLRYQAGESTVLEVVDAQNALTLAESARADGLVRYRIALANLQTITGQLP